MARLGTDGGTRVQIKEQLDYHPPSIDVFNNVEVIQKVFKDNVPKYFLHKNSVPELNDNIRSIEEMTDNTNIMPTSTISSNCRRNLKSRNSSRNSRNRSTSTTQKQSQKFIVAKSKKGTKSKNYPRLECYKIPLGNDSFKGNLKSSNSRSKSKRSKNNNSKIRK